MKAHHHAWCDDPLRRDPEHLMFIGETGASTNLGRRYAGCGRSRHPRVGLLHGHHKTITFVSGLRRSGLVAPRAFDGAMNAERSEAWVYDDLGSTLRTGDIVVTDNLSSHKSKRLKQVLASFGASVLYLPPYCPDLNPIETAYAELKANLRKLAERSASGPMMLLERCARIFNPAEAADFFAARGYETD